MTNRNDACTCLRVPIRNVVFAIQPSLETRVADEWIEVKKREVSQ